MSGELRIQSEVMRAIGILPNVRIFRNQVGVGWLGKVVSEDRRAQTVVLSRAYRVTMGLAVGSSDLIGYRRRIITPDDVGKEFAQFLSVEVKSPTGVISDEQRNWINRVHQWGGIAFVTRSKEDAVNTLKP
jgi:hypothetical protein